MKYICLLTVFFSFLCFSVSAQYVFVPDQTTGKTVSISRYEKVNGNPYFIDNWVKAEVKLMDGRLITATKVKYDIVDDKLLYLKDDKVFEFSPKALSFKLFISNLEHDFIWDDEKISGYYETLVVTPILFLRKRAKVVLEQKGYNSANVEKLIQEDEKYFIKEGSNYKQVKLTKKSFLKALPQFVNEITAAQLEEGNLESFVSLVKTLK